MSTEITVSIINYKTADLTIACTQSVLDDIAHAGLKERGHVVVVDNASGDSSADVISDWLDQHSDPDVRTCVTLVRSTTNSGFSGGHNQGMLAKPAAFYLLLNSDAVLRPGFLHTILQTAKNNPQAGFVAPQLEDDDTTVQVSSFRFASPMSEFIRSACTGLITKLFARYDISLGTDPDPTQFGWASFACILLRGEMVDQIGLMDEGYFLYFEDADYCLTAHRAGWRIARAPDARAVHFRGGSGPVKSLAKAYKRMPRYYYASRTRFLYKAYGRAGPVLANLMWLLGRGVAQLRRLAGRKPNPMVALEYRDIWTNVFHPHGPSYGPDSQAHKKG